MQPKARWTHLRSNVWTASIGVFVLSAETDIGHCVIYANRAKKSLGGATRYVLWSTLVPTPCDAPDLMRLCESELSRRLRIVADTLAGDELAPLPAEGLPDTHAPARVSAVQGDGRVSCTPTIQLHAITSFAQLCDTLDALPPGLCIERAYVDGDRPPQIWHRIDVDEYAVSLVREGITQVRYHSRSRLQVIEYQSATCRVVQNSTTTG
jgi:hypothetical protein